MPGKESTKMKWSKGAYEITKEKDGVEIDLNRHSSKIVCHRVPRGTVHQRSLPRGLTKIQEEIWKLEHEKIKD